MSGMITVSVFVKAPIEKVWQYWTEPKYITQWAFASDDWMCPRATNDVREDGEFVTRMEAKDGSAGFDLKGKYIEVAEEESLMYAMEDGRTVAVTFEEQEDGVLVTQDFVPEKENSEELRRAGWQAILENFKRLAERNWAAEEVA